MAELQPESLRLTLVDANVLWGRYTRMTLVGCAKGGICRIAWTGKILDELERNLREDQFRKPEASRLTADQIGFIVRELRGDGGRMKPDPEPDSVAAIGREYTRDADDRHLLATCVEHGIGTLVTEDKGFDVEACASGLGVAIISPDDFFLSLLSSKFGGVMAAIEEWLESHKGRYDLTRSLFEGCPRFEALVRARFGSHFGLPSLG